MHRVLVGIALGEEVVVRRHEEARVGVLDVGQILDRQVAVPLVAAVARDRHEAAPARPPRRDARRLIPDGPVDTRPDHVLGGNAAVAARVAELVPASRLIHAQAREVGRGAGLHPRGTDGVGLVVLAVLEEHGPVPRVLQLHRGGRAALDRDRVLDDPHVLPGPAIAVLVRVRGVRLVDVEVFPVAAEDRQPPGAALVVPDRHSGEHRLAGSDDVPARGDEVDPVAQRRGGLRPVRVVHHHRLAAPGPPAAHDPVVAADVPRTRGVVARRHHAARRAAESRSDLVGRELQRLPKRAIQLEDPVVDERKVDHGIPARNTQGSSPCRRRPRARPGRTPLPAGRSTTARCGARRRPRSSSGQA